MKHRLFQIIKAGEWAAAALSDESFPDDDYADRIAESLGLLPGDVAAVDIEDGVDDPRKGDLLFPIEQEVQPAPSPVVLEKHTVLRGA